MPCRLLQCIGLLVIRRRPRKLCLSVHLNCSRAVVDRFYTHTNFPVLVLEILRSKRLLHIWIEKNETHADFLYRHRTGASFNNASACLPTPSDVECATNLRDHFVSNTRVTMYICIPAAKDRDIPAPQRTWGNVQPKWRKVRFKITQAYFSQAPFSI